LNSDPEALSTVTDQPSAKQTDTITDSPDSPDRASSVTGNSPSPALTYEKTICVAMTGASGIQYALRLIECLIKADCEVYVLMSKPAQIVMGMDTDIPVPSRTAKVQEQFSAMYGAKPGQLKAFGQQEWTAPVASGSGAPDAMVICPCTTGTLASVAAGTCNNLLERAADVVIKEGRKLIVMPREMPFSLIHLENMQRLARAGVIIMPPNPAFYKTAVVPIVQCRASRWLDASSVV